METKHIGLEGESVIRVQERLFVCTVTGTMEEVHSVENDATHMVFIEALRAGSGTMKRDEFLDAEGKLGTHITISEGDGTIRVGFQVLDTFLPQTLKLLDVLLQKPRFEAREISRIKEHLVNALTLAKEDARGHAYSEFVNTLVSKDDARYSFSIDDTITAVKKVTAGDLKKLHSAFLLGSWLYTVGGSEKSCTQVIRSLTAIKKVHKGKEIQKEARLVKSPTKRTIIQKDIPNKQNIELSIGGALPLTRTMSDFVAFTFGMSVLALYGGFTGRLMSTVREKEGLTYTIYGRAESVTKIQEGYWRIMTFFAPKDAEKGINSTIREITTMHEKGITKDELTRFKAILNTRRALLQDSLIKQVADIHAQREIGLTKDEYKTFVEEIQNLTLKQVNEAMKKYLNPKTLVISAAGPIKSVKKQLESFGT
jgi:zinc protease